MKSSTARATSKPTTSRATSNATTNATTERGRASPARSTRASPARTTRASPVRTTAASPARTRASPGRNRTSLLNKTVSTKMSPELCPPITAPRRSISSAPTTIRQSATPTRIPTYSGSRASTQIVSRGLSPPLEGNSPGKNNSMATTRIPSPNTVLKGITSPARNSISSPAKKQILSHDFLSKTTSKSRGQSPLNRSIDEPSALQLRRHSAPSSKIHDYMSKSHDHGSLALISSCDRGPKFLSKSQNLGPKSLSTSQDRGFMSKSHDRGFMSKSQDRGFMSKSQDKGFMSKSQDRGSLIGYANQNAAPRKVTVPEYGYDGRRKSTSSRDATPRLSSASQGGLNRRDGLLLHLQMGRSVDSTVSLSTAASSPIRGGRHDAHRLIPLQLSDPIMSQGYRSGDLTPEEASPLDGRVPASTLRTKHRQLKSPDFFDVKKLDGDGGVITAVSRMHQNSKGLVVQTGASSSEEDQDKLHPEQQSYYEQRRDCLADSARKAFSAETDSAIGSSHFSSEINYKLEKALNGAQDLLEIGSWNDDDEEYLRTYKHGRGGVVDTSFDKTSDSVVVAVNHIDDGANTSKKWGQFSKIPEVGHLSQYDNALYQKSESDLGTSTQASPQASPPRGGSAALRATTATSQPAAVSRISSTSATSIDLNRSTDTTCSTYSQYDNAFWADPPPINGTFRPWNPKREAEMTPTAVVVPTLPEAELPHPPQQSSVLHPPQQSSPREPVANAATINESNRMSRYNDGLERLTSYMKTASQQGGARKTKGGLSDDFSSNSQASDCFDYLVDFLESQTSITDVLVSAHDETLKLNDFAHSAAVGGAAHMNASAAVKRLDSKMTNDTAMMSNRSIESRITDLGSEASWESGKSRSVQTLGSTTGKVMDQITEKVDSLSFDSPKHLSTFKFGLKKTTMGACETITSSDQAAAKPGDGSASNSVPPSRADSERFFPQRKSVSIPVQHQPPSPNLSWPSQTAPSSINASRNPSRNPSLSPSQRTFSDEKLAAIAHRLPSPLSTSIRQIKIVSEAGVESRREDEALAVSPSAEAGKPPVAETSFPRSPELLRKPSPSSSPSSKKTKLKLSAGSSVESLKVAVEQGSASPTVEAPAKYVQMQHSRDGSKLGSATPEVDRGLVKRGDRDNLSLRLDQANKGCGCNIL